MEREVLKATKEEWREFIDKGLLFLGSGLFIVGIIFFFAYNWDNLHKFVKLSIPFSILLLSTILILKSDLDKMIVKASSFVAIFAIGVEFALFGQIYQTGADSWKLFFIWSIFAIGFVFTLKFSLNYLIWFILLNIATILYLLNYYYDFIAILKSLIILNLLLLILSKYLIIKFNYNNFEWLKVVLIFLFLFFFTQLLFIYGVEKKKIDFFIGFPFYILSIAILFKIEKESFLVTSLIILSLIFVLSAFNINLVKNWYGKFYIGTLSFLIYGFFGIKYLLKRIKNEK